MRKGRPRHFPCHCCKHCCKHRHQLTKAPPPPFHWHLRRGRCSGDLLCVHPQKEPRRSLLRGQLEQKTRGIGLGDVAEDVERGVEVSQPLRQAVGDDALAARQASRLSKPLAVNTEHARHLPRHCTITLGRERRWRDEGRPTQAFRSLSQNGYGYIYIYISIYMYTLYKQYTLL